MNIRIGRQAYRAAATPLLAASMSRASRPGDPDVLSMRFVVEDEADGRVFLLDGTEDEWRTLRARINAMLPKDAP